MGYRENYEKWLNSPVVDEATKEELRAIAGNDDEIKGRFSKLIDFGTAGLRGKMFAGLSGMNVYIIRYFTQGLANLIKECGEDYSGGVTVIFDCRNNSKLFADTFYLTYKLFISHYCDSSISILVINPLFYLGYKW